MVLYVRFQIWTLLIFSHSTYTLILSKKGGVIFLLTPVHFPSFYGNDFLPLHNITIHINLYLKYYFVMYKFISKLL